MGDELGLNGYEVLRGKRLKSFKLTVKEQFDTDIGVGIKTQQLGIFDFRAFLNIAMLLTESERARVLRQTILDIVIDTINQRTGGSIKYINQRDEDFILAYFQEENYWKIQYVGISDILRKMVNPMFQALIGKSKNYWVMRIVINEADIQTAALPDRCYHGRCSLFRRTRSGSTKHSNQVDQGSHRGN